MPILLVIFLVAACAPVAWPETPFHWGVPGAVTIMLAALSLVTLSHVALGRWAVVMLTRDPTMRVVVSRKYSRFRRLIGLSHFALSIAVIGLGWGWAVQQMCVI